MHEAVFRAWKLISLLLEYCAMVWNILSCTGFLIGTYIIVSYAKYCVYPVQVFYFFCHTF